MELGMGNTWGNMRNAYRLSSVTKIKILALPNLKFNYKFLLMF